VHGSDSNNCMSSQQACKTIGHAISLAASGDSIMVAAATYHENLAIGKSLQIIGGSAATTIVDGGGVNTVVKISNASAHVTVSNLTIRNGRAGAAGGIINSSTLTINNSTVSGNNAFVGCEFTCIGARGGGIYNVGSLTINNKTLSGNTASAHYCIGSCFAHGGGIYNHGTLTINNSTVSGNHATWSGLAGSAIGGGIDNFGSLTINNGTISGNIASHGGGIDNAGGGGTATLQNSIVANSPSGGNCTGSITSNGYNLSSDNTCNFQNSGDRNNINPLLGPLQNNGGPTQTMALVSGSPAIDAGNPSGCKDGSGHLLTTDQRGMPRHDLEDSRGCDMGAYERQTD
jgi:hypothetical protein